MNAAQRLAYLAELGVDSYLPRWQLPGAAPSPQGEIPVAPSAPKSHAGQGPRAAQLLADSSTPSANSAPPPTPAEPIPADHAAPNITALETKRAQQTEPVSRAGADGTGAEARANVAPTAATPEPPPRFTLACWRLGERLLVDEHQRHLAPQQARLLSNMLSAIGQQPDQLLGPSLFEWPLFDNPNTDQGPAVAREAVQAFMETQLRQTPACELWLLGEAPQQFVVGDPEIAQWSLAGERLRVLRLPSTLRMFDSAEAKRRAWQQLRNAGLTP